MFSLFRSSSGVRQWFGTLAIKTATLCHRKHLCRAAHKLWLRCDDFTGAADQPHPITITMTNLLMAPTCSMMVHFFVLIRVLPICFEFDLTRRLSCWIQTFRTFFCVVLDAVTKWSFIFSQRSKVELCSHRHYVIRITMAWVAPRLVQSLGLAPNTCSGISREYSRVHTTLCQPPIKVSLYR